MPRKTRATKVTPDGRRLIAQNRRARHDYDILETFECGIVLVGSEVKSLRDGKCQLKDSYARIEGGEAWLFGVHIPQYSFATGFGGHDPDRKRKLLLHRREIDELRARSQQESLTIIPLAVYFDRGKVKIQVALARGRHTYDKRRVLAERDARRETERALRGRE